MRSLILLSLLALFITPKAQAGFLIDPYVGTGTAKTSFDLAGQSDDDDSLSTYGARLGYSILLFSAGIDYAKGTFGDVDFTNTSVFVGVDLPILLRAWAEYFVNSDIDNDKLGSADFKMKDGTSIGLGFTGLPFVSLNLEVQNINYEMEYGASKSDVQTAAYIFSVSLPLDF